MKTIESKCRFDLYVTVFDVHNSRDGADNKKCIRMLRHVRMLHRTAYKHN